MRGLGIGCRRAWFWMWLGRAAAQSNHEINRVRLAFPATTQTCAIRLAFNGGGAAAQAAQCDAIRVSASTVSLRALPS